MLPERKSQSLMSQAEGSRLKMVEIIRQGETGSLVTMDLNRAAIVLRVDKDSFLRMGSRGQELGISVKGEKVTVRVSGGTRTERMVYRQFYGLLQAVSRGIGQQFLEEIDGNDILKSVPNLRSTLEVIEKGNDLPECEMVQLQTILLASWESLRDRSDLPSPEQVFNSLP